MARSRPLQGRRKHRRRGRQPVPWKLLAAPLLIAVGGVALMVYLAMDVDELAGRADPAAEQWAVRHWRTPIPPQGEAPADYVPRARSLAPKDCGACHPQQYADWQESLHSRTMGPGVVGQFPGMHAASANQCRSCHAPMSEQYPMLRNDQGRLGENPRHDPALEAAGLGCAACHVRRHRRYGPPLREGKTGQSHLVHGEPVRTPYFEAAEFCKTCHQHATSAFKVAGRPVENTYREWLDSPYAEQGRTCQDCHMPDRRHRWKGIHDRDMTRQAVTLGVTVNGEPVGAGNEPVRIAPGEPLSARLTLRNTGAGHAFPTYTTPAVFLKAAFRDADGRALPGHYEEHVIQRRLDTTTNPWTQEFDTRVMPGEAATLTFSRTVPAAARDLYLWVWVEPDHFYTGFFRARLQGGGDFRGADRLREALETTHQRQYLLFSRTVPVRREG